MIPASRIARYSIAQRVGERVDELLLGGVVLVAEPVDARRRDARDEGVDDVDALERRREVRDVLVDVAADVLDRAVADPEQPGRLLVLAVLLAVGVDRHELGVEARGPSVRLGIEPGGQRHVGRRHLARRDARHAVVDVGDPARLAHLAVVDDVHADLRLLGDHVGDRALEVAVERVGVVLVVGLTRLEGGRQVSRASAGCRRGWSGSGPSVSPYARSNSSCRSASPRNVGLTRCEGWVPAASRMSSSRAKRRSNAMCASRRPSGAPMQKCGPLPKAR